MAFPRFDVWPIGLERVAQWLTAPSFCTASVSEPDLAHPLLVKRGRVRLAHARGTERPPSQLRACPSTVVNGALSKMPWRLGQDDRGLMVAVGRERRPR